MKMKLATIVMATILALGSTDSFAGGRHRHHHHRPHHRVHHPHPHR